MNTIAMEQSLITVPSNLFDNDVDFVAVLHVEVLRGLVFVESFSVEQEADVGCLELG